VEKIIELTQKNIGKFTMQSASIPIFLNSFFWEYDTATIDTAKHASLIMGRIMERGSWEAMRWLHQTYSADDLALFLRTKGIQILPARELNFWALLCGVPDRTRNHWVKKARAKNSVWTQRYAH